ncbi:MAG: peptidylprolyl isomerase [Cytophagales bacterium]|nr:peptidylprolyl isomerase [Cytophagales bacterium]
MQKIRTAIVCLFFCASCASFKNPFLSRKSNKLDENQTFLTVDKTPFSVKDFLYVYNKNKNLRTPGKDAKKDIDQYLELYVNFRLKIREAEALQYHEKETFRKELEQYQKELAEPFLTANEFTNEKVKEAYERYRQEVHASHILVRHSTDSAKNLQKIRSVLEKARQGEDFGDLAYRFSEDPSAKTNKGDLGFFSIMRMVQEFEEKAFTTPVGQISEPFQTKFGYHIIKVHEKIPARGRIQIAHILVGADSRRASQEETAEAFDKAMRIHNALKDGADWSEQCRLFSDHKPTVDKDGLLPEFSPGQMHPDFEAAAFALSKENPYSEPVQSAIGWHILKFVQKKPVAEFKEIENRLKSHVRFNLGKTLHQEELVQRLKSRYNFVGAEGGVPAAIWEQNLTHNDSLPVAAAPLFYIGKKAYTTNDFKEFAGRQKPLSDQEWKAQGSKLYQQFVKEQLLAYEKENLALVNDDYKYLSQEYHDGILLFQLMQDKVWNFANQDTVGLENFLKAHQDNYQWPDRVKVQMYSSENPELYKHMKHCLEEKDLAKDSRKQLECLQKKLPDLSVREGVFNHNDSIFNQRVAMNPGEYSYQKNARHYYVKVKEALKARPQELKEIRGTLVADYQDHIEKEWLQELRKKYEVKVNQRVLKALYREYENNKK